MCSAAHFLSDWDRLRAMGVTDELAKLLADGFITNFSLKLVSFAQLLLLAPLRPAGCAITKSQAAAPCTSQKGFA